MHDFGSDLDSNSDSLHVVDCGFCSKEPSECVCRAISMDLNQLIDSTVTLSTSPVSPTAARSSILDNLPPVQPGVPLKLRRSRQSAARANSSLTEDEPVRLTPVPQLVRLQTVSGPSSRPVCSGDPSNCAACADDPFGRAFCTALATGSICRDNTCTRCPKNNQPTSPKTTPMTEDKDKDKPVLIDVDVGPTSGVGLGMGMSVETGMLLCCGDPKLCGGGGCGMRAPSSPPKVPQLQRPPLRTAGSSSASFEHPESHTRSIADIEEGDKNHIRLPPFAIREGQGEDVDKDIVDQDIPTNEAWARLKAHPNVGFADLDLLADVVARRTKCTGPRVLLSPTPEEDVGSHRRDGEGESEEEAADQGQDQDSLPLPSTLVPQAALVRCGRERLMRVQAEGVRDALAMLDVQRPT